MFPLGSISRSHQDRTTWARPLDWATNWEEWDLKALLTGLLKSTLRWRKDGEQTKTRCKRMMLRGKPHDRIMLLTVIPEHGTERTEQREPARRHLTQLDVTHWMGSGAAAHVRWGDETQTLHLHRLQLSPTPQQLWFHQLGVDGGPVRNRLTTLLQCDVRSDVWSSSVIMHYIQKRCTLYYCKKEVSLIQKWCLWFFLLHLFIYCIFLK